LSKIDHGDLITLRSGQQEWMKNLKACFQGKNSSHKHRPEQLQQWGKTLWPSTALQLSVKVALASHVRAVKDRRAAVTTAAKKGQAY
jgi:hypothetical protein